MSKKSELDKYYTKPSIAEMCYNSVKHLAGAWVEPSAGDGVFLDLLPNGSIGYDISPESENVVKKDWFTVGSINGSVIGNPPFGKNSSLAVKFFNHAADLHSPYICFILPRTFRKDSIQNRLDPHYHIILDIDIPPDSFLLDGESYDVPCCFQVWERRDSKRRKERQDNFLFEVVNEGHYDFLVRRVGGRAGQIVESGASSSTYKIKSKIDVELLKALFHDSLEDIKKVRDNTAGVRSISGKELFKILKGEL